MCAPSVSNRASTLDILVKPMSPRPSATLGSASPQCGFLTLDGRRFVDGNGRCRACNGASRISRL